MIERGTEGKKEHRRVNMCQSGSMEYIGLHNSLLAIHSNNKKGENIIFFFLIEKENFPIFSLLFMSIFYFRLMVSVVDIKCCYKIRVIFFKGNN